MENFDYNNEDLDIEPSSDVDEEILELERYDISFFPADYTLGTIYSSLQKDQILFPDFQRKFVWDEKRQSRLIESFLLGLPVPQFFLVKTDDSKLLVVDGLQRLSTIKNFYDGKLKLTGIKKAWEGLTYKELAEEDRDHLDGQPARSIVVKQNTPKEDNTSMFFIFERLNTGGVTLTPMEIRRAIYPSPFIILIENLNIDKNWRKIIGKENLDKRLKDAELILRSFAIANDFDKYPGTIRNLLNRTAKRTQKNKIDYSNLQDQFTKACAEMVKQIGEKPFHQPKGRLNASVLDVVMAALLDPKTSMDKLKEKYDALLADDEFHKALQQKDTARTEVIKNRIALANKYFK